MSKSIEILQQHDDDKFIDDFVAKFANHYLHLIFTAFVPYSDLKLHSASIEIDGDLFACGDNLRFCQPYPNKNYYVIQQKPTYRNRNEDGLLFLTSDPEGGKIIARIYWEWFFTFRPNDIVTSIQTIEFTINNFPNDGIVPPNHVISTGRHNAPTMVFTSNSFDEIDWKMERSNAIPDFVGFGDGDNLNGVFIKSLTQKLPLEIYSMENWFKITDKRPKVFDH